MKPRVLSVEEGIDEICKNLLAKCTPSARNGLLEIAYKLSIGAVTSIAVTAREDDGVTEIIISDDEDQRRALREQLEDMEFDLQPDSPTERESAQVFPFPSVAPRTSSGA